MTEFKYKNLELDEIYQINSYFKLNNVSKICESMAALGMYCDDDNLILNFIEKSLYFHDPWVRKSGIIALNHINRRFKENLDKKRVIKIIAQGLFDSNEMVKNEVLDVIEELEIFNPTLYPTFDEGGKRRRKPQ